MGAEPIWLTEADVAALVDLPAANDAVRATLVLQHLGRAQTMEKTSVVWGDGHTLHAIGGEVAGSELVGTKTWAHTAGGAMPLLVLWDAATGRLRAVVEAFALGQLRTAAVSAVATDLLAAPDADVLAVIGSGKQAFAQAAAVASVRTLRSIRVHSPTPDHREAFAERLREADAAPDISACSSVSDAVDGAGVVTTVTRASDAFLHGAMLTGTPHTNAVGSISPERRELADDVVAGAALVVADSPDAARRLSSELDAAAEVRSLADVAASGSTKPGRTVFKAMGIGLADVAVGAEALARAEEVSAGRPIAAPTRAAPRFFGGEQ